MKMNPGETFEEWAARVHKHELEVAHKELAKGVPAEQVLEAASKRITQKLMHPIITAVRESTPNYDPEESRRKYKESYLDLKSKPD